MKPYYQDDAVTIYHGDALTVLPQIEGWDMLLTDPPYSSGGMMRSDRSNASVIAKYVSSGTQAPRMAFSGDNRDQRGYLAWVSLWMAAALQSANEGAMAALFTDWRQLPVTSDALQAGGWVWRGVAVWDKTLKARPAEGVYTSQAEYVVWGTAGSRAGRRLGYQIPGVMSHPSADLKDRHHIAEKPEAVMRWLLAPAAGVVVDPFMGSGSTLVAAQQMGLKVVGIEIEEAYCETAVKRLAHRPLFGEAAA